MLNNTADLAAVNTDALIEGNTAGMAALTAEIQAQFPAALAAFVARMQAADNAWMVAQAPSCNLNTVEVDESYKGRRFVRILRRTESSRSVVCFVELGTGLIYKAASFKKPAENFTRGCVFNLGAMFQHKVTGAIVATIPSF